MERRLHFARAMRPLASRLGSSSIAVALALSGCGRSELFDSLAPSALLANGSDGGLPDVVDPPPASNPTGDVFWHFAHSGEAMKMIGIHLRDGSIDPRSFDLPYSASTVTDAEAWPNHVVRVTRKDGRQTIETRGPSWQRLAEVGADGSFYGLSSAWGEWQRKVSTVDGRTWFWITSRTKSDAVDFSVKAFLLRNSEADETLVTPMLDLTPNGSTFPLPLFDAFAPFGIFMRAGGDLLLRTIDLAQPIVPILSGVDQSSRNVFLTFDTSFIAREPNSSSTILDWFDLEGARAHVPGYEPKETLWIDDANGHYQVDDPPGNIALYALGDRTAERVADFGPMESSDYVADVWPDRATPVTLVRYFDRTDQWTFVGAGGVALAAFTPAPSRYRCKAGTDSYPSAEDPSGFALNANTSEIVVLIPSYQSCSDGSMAGMSLDALRLDRQSGRLVVTRLLEQEDTTPLPFFELSKSGDYAAVIADEKLTVLDTRTGALRTLDPGMALMDRTWAVHGDPTR